MQHPPSKTHELLLRRRGLLFVESTGEQLPDDYIKAVEIQLAELGTHCRHNCARVFSERRSPS